MKTVKLLNCFVNSLEKRFLVHVCSHLSVRAKTWIDTKLKSVKLEVFQRPAFCPAKREQNVFKQINTWWKKFRSSLKQDSALQDSSWDRSHVAALFLMFQFPDRLHNSLDVSKLL